MSISVTLNFANEQELVAFFSGKKAVLQTEAPKAEAKKSVPVQSAASSQSPADKPASAPTTGPAEGNAPAATATTASPTASTASQAKPEPSAGVDRAAVSAAIVKLAVKDKAKTIEILAGFGVKAGKELKDEQLADCFAQVTEALGA